VLGHAVEQARQNAGPQMVVAQLLRLCGHGEHDDAGYVTPNLKASDLGRDCLEVAESTLLQKGWAGAAQIQSWRRDAVQQVESSVAKVQREPAPDPQREDWLPLASGHLRETHKQR
jgi:TPP-dependent pyruvate/acetoin dehydrogenase alpha subunit